MFFQLQSPTHPQANKKNNHFTLKSSGKIKQNPLWLFIIKYKYFLLQSIVSPRARAVLRTPSGPIVCRVLGWQSPWWQGGRTDQMHPIFQPVATLQPWFHKEAKICRATTVCSLSEPITFLLWRAKSFDSFKQISDQQLSETSLFHHDQRGTERCLFYKCFYPMWAWCRQCKHNPQLKIQCHPQSISPLSVTASAPMRQERERSPAHPLPGIIMLHNLRRQKAINRKVNWEANSIIYNPEQPSQAWAIRALEGRCESLITRAVWHTHTHTHTHTFIHICTPPHRHPHLYTHIHKRVYTHIVDTHTHKHKRVYTHIVDTHTHKHKRVYTHIVDTHTHKHKRVYTHIVDACTHTHSLNYPAVIVFPSPHQTDTFQDTVWVWQVHFSLPFLPLTLSCALSSL